MNGDAPRIGFLIGGVQKAGTTALARYLAGHPQLALPQRKEAHVFDDPGFGADWDRARIDREYARHFDAGSDDRLHGDATPIYLFHPTLVERIAAYNPAMRWIVLLRDPLERAISQYGMERARGDEHWPLWAALLFERLRLRGHHHDWSPASPLRHWSYRARGDYGRQLRTLRAHFPDAQVLVLRSTELRVSHVQVLARICAFLGVRDFNPAPAEITAFEGESPRVSRATALLARWCLRRESREYRQL